MYEEAVYTVDVADDSIVVTGSAGLIGAALSRDLLDDGYTVVGIDNDSRKEFFGVAGSTAGSARRISAEYPGRYRDLAVDISDKKALYEALDSTVGTDPVAMVHCAAQPSHDWAGWYPLRDFEVNALGTVYLLDWARTRAARTPFIFFSSNKVYSAEDVDAIGLAESETRFEPLESSYRQGIDESFPLGRGSRSLYGTSKLSADLVAQEYGNYYGMPTVVLRFGSMTGAGQAAVESHGFLGHLTRQVLEGATYTVNGYAGKQVRDVLHAGDAVRAVRYLIADSWQGARVFNLGGGPENACSVLEAISIAAGLTGVEPKLDYRELPRKSDFRWWVTCNSAFMRCYPGWRPTKSVRDIVADYADDLRTP